MMKSHECSVRKVLLCKQAFLHATSEQNASLQVWWQHLPQHTSNQVPEGCQDAALHTSPLKMGAQLQKAAVRLHEWAEPFLPGPGDMCALSSGSLCVHGRSGSFTRPEQQLQLSEHF